MVAPVFRELVFGPEARGERLDQHLARALVDLTRSRVQQLIEAGEVRVNGQVARVAQRLKGGEQVRLHLPAPVEAKPRPEDLPLDVLYEDRDLVVVNKAPGMVVHPGAGHSGGTLVNALLHRVKDLSGVGGELRPGIVHRLDKDTSGCLVVAKHERSLVALQEAFKQRDVQKRYLALVQGAPPLEGYLETFYGRHPVHRQRFTGKLKAGKKALTRYRRLEAFEGAALLEVDLLTGRTHQIRVHLSEAGYPLLCDILYGGKKKRSDLVASAEAVLKRQGLHAWKLDLPHPRTSKRLSFEAPLPEDLESALAVLRA